MEQGKRKRNKDKELHILIFTLAHFLHQYHLITLSRGYSNTISFDSSSEPLDHTYFILPEWSLNPGRN